MATGRYPEIDPQPSFPDLEREIIASWEEQKTFQATLDQRTGAPDFVFYDGPPFANGLPHYGHLLTGFVKDIVPRYRTMRGARVERRFGWDCHGLPVEMEAEKNLGVTGRKAIEELGVDQFNAYCRSLVGTTADTWDAYVRRQARWVDMANDYKTMDLTYMESVMWALKQLHEKDLLYEGHRVLPYCWECETPLSNFETRLDDAYRDRTDPALTVWVQLGNGDRLLIWTTTPWTLPSNLAIAVGPTIEYAVFEEDGQRYLVGANAAAAYERELAGATRVGTVTGADLVGQRYEPLFPYFADTENAFQILGADFVTDEDGTGAVHLAPGFGEDDQAVCEAAGIPVVVPVDERGRYTAEVTDYVGQHVFDANKPIAADLKARGQVIRHDNYVHSYPHCWRTDTPLIYRAMSSWFVRVTAIKDRMAELNQEVTWVPGHVKDGAFGKWLENARDWSISRNRFWGSPLPIWKSDDPRYPRVDVYGSLDDLERDFGTRPDDLHRPGIDELTRPNPDDPTGQSTMRRVEDVLDCWFESGSMPFAQVHYPFENQEWFDAHFPGDFICEYVGQVRGWFYTLHVLATALFDRPAFKTCVAHGILLGNDGQKLSKRLKNYPDPQEIFDTLGADAMRWGLVASPALRGGDVVADRQPMEEAVRQVLLPIWNAWYFLGLYANAADKRGRMVDEAPGGPRADALDRYALAKTRQLVDQVTDALDVNDVPGACASLTSYLEALNNWYIRRSRDRFWSGDQAAIDTLHTALTVTCQAAAPLLPLLTDAVYRGLTGEASVHLTDWPDPATLPSDDALVDAMDAVRDVCSAALSLRSANGLRVRLPLASLDVAWEGPSDLRPFVDLIASEVNVKAVHLTDDQLGVERLEIDLKSVAPRLGPDTPKVMGALRKGDYTYDAGLDELRVLDHRFVTGEFTRRWVPSDPDTTAALPGGRGLLRLDTAPTPELEAEGLARDVMRLVNQVRKDENLHVSDRIHLVVDPGHHDDVRHALEAHRQMVAEETLAVEFQMAEAERPLSVSHRVELPDGRALHVAIHRSGAERP
jgi:isoleucyl-tRNA synthetase